MPQRNAGPESDEAALAARFARHLRERAFFEPGQCVLVAVSGGLDSVVLLHLLRFAVPALELRLVAAHLDHAMRESSVADADWVRGLCVAWGVPLISERAKRPPRAETDARAVRYAFLEAAADRVAADRIATGHHADDQSETVLFRISRGTGLRGLAGIPERRGRIVRPLLPFTRADIRRYARLVGLRYRFDPSNLELGHARNRIRHEVLPALESISPGASRAIRRLAAHAAAADSALDRLLEHVEREVVIEAAEDGELLLARQRLLSYHAPIRARLLRKLLRRLGSRPDRAGTRTALTFMQSGASGARIEMAGGVVLEREFDRFRLRRAETATASGQDRAVVIAGPGEGSEEAVIGGRRWHVRWTLMPGHDGDAQAVFDPALLDFPLHFRSWRAGDRIRFDYGRKKLKKLFGERRIGRAERGRVPVLADARGRVLWVPGIARSADAPPRPGDPSLRFRVYDGDADG